jgi:PAS domain S-box-containing protein
MDRPGRDGVREPGGESPLSHADGSVDARLRLLLDGITDFAIFMMDPLGRISTWSSGAERLKGYRAEEIIGRNFSCFYPQADIAAGKPEHELELARITGRYEEEGWRVRKDGTSFFANVIITALRDPSGELLGFGKVTRDVTERQRARRQVNELHERLERAVRATRDGLFEGGDFRTGDDLWVSPRWWEILGYDPNDAPSTLSGALITEMIHPEDRDLVMQARLSSLQSGAPCSIEHRMRTRQGTWIWVLMRAAIERVANAEAIRVSGSMQDISARKEIESQLVDANERFAMASAAAGLGFFTYDIDASTVEWNDRMFELYGRTRSDGAQPYELWAGSLHPEDLKRCEREVLDALSGAAVYDTEFRVLRPDGQLRHIKAIASITRDAGGRAVQMVGLNFDITERQRADERFKLAIEAAPTGMLLISRAGTIVMVNGQIERIFGYSRAELLGLPLEMLLPQRYRTPHPEHRQRFLTDPKTRPMLAGREAHGLRKDGSEVPIELGLSPLETSEGEFVLASVVDVTDRRDAMVRLRLLNDELEKQVRVQTMALIHDTLYQSKDFSRVPFAHYARSLAENILSAVGELSSAISLELSLDELSLPVDKAIPCGLILNELITNALKHAFPDGTGGTVRIELGRLGECDVLLSVGDNGIGIPSGFRPENSNSLGSRLVTTLVTQLDGRLEIKGPPGATFRISFPVEPQA